MFFNIFNVKTPAWYAATSAGSRLSGELNLTPARPSDMLIRCHFALFALLNSVAGSNRRSAGASTPQGAVTDGVPAHEKTNLIDQYLSVLLLIFIEAGLVEVSSLVNDAQLLPS